jgi:ectoine hydroxylase-related dioxygenase (phytanoyl-CoA dioxygenase family)
MRFTDQEKKQFHQDGFLTVRQLFSREETSLLINATKSDESYNKQDGGPEDASGQQSKLRLRNYLEDDVSSAFVATRRIVDNMEFLLEDEVYHFHHKMMLKEPLVGGAWEWHQDYGYWYENNHCLYPDMASCAISIDPCTKENGCMQFLKSSHLCGRINHIKIATQSGADPERVEELKKSLELVYGTMEPGDALFFHANTLHRSDANLSNNPRWVLIGCYNTKHNNPYKDSGSHPCYHPLKKIDDEDLLRIAGESSQKATE